MIKIVIIDLDNTLTESRQKISPEMAKAFEGLLEVKDVAIISGGTFPQIEFQVLSEISPDTNLDRLTLLPQSGTSCLQNKDGKWEKVYSFEFDEKEKEQIYGALDNIYDIEPPESSTEPRVEDKGGQITYSPVGITSPPEMKAPYDPDHSKRKKIADALKELLPDFEIGIGGLSSIDITRKGMNKSFGVSKIIEIKNVLPEEVIFIGDALWEGGNDAPACLPETQCIQVSGPDETRVVIKKIIEGKEMS